MNRHVSIVTSLIVAAASVVIALEGEPAPTITAADYARAEQWLRHKVEDLVLNIFVTPHWIGDQDRFWYRRDTVDGHEFVVVDAANGDRAPAFDHAAMAEALTALGLADVDVAKLPFEEIEFEREPRAVTFAVEDTAYRCAVEPVECVAVPGDYEPPGILLSPDRRWGVLARHGNLWLHDMETGSETRLTEDGEENFGYGIYYGNWQAASIPNQRAGTPLPPMASEWSPDSTKVLVTRIDQRHVAEYAWLETAPEDGSFRPKVHTARIPLMGEEPARCEWFVFDVPSGQRVRLDLPYDRLFHVHQDALALREVWWSSDSGHLYTIAWGDNISAAYLFDVDLETGQVRTAVSESMSPRMDTNSTSYNPPNVRVIGDCDKVIWFSQRTGWGHLYLYDGTTGELKNPITSGDWLVRDIIHVDQDKRQVFFTAGGREPGSPYERYLYRVDFDGDNLTLLSPEPGDHMLTSPWNDILAMDGAFGYNVVSPSGKYVVYNYSRVDQPTRTVIRRVSDGGLIAEVERADATALYDAGWRNPEEFVVKAADGQTDLYGVMYLPRDLDPELRYPVVDSQYASPLTAVVPRNFMMAVQGAPTLASSASLTELGFVDVVIDARGTTFRSRQFSHYSWQNLNTIGLEDHVAAIIELGERHAWMDTGRVGIHGGSYGGWTVFRAMFEFPEFFKVGIAGAPPGSMHNMYPDYHWNAFHGRPVYADGGHLRPGPTDRPVNFANADGTQNAAALEGKLLIMMGEIDENVLPASTLQLVDALVDLDKDFDLVLFPNTSHKIRNRHSIRREWDYLVRHLHGVEPPEYHIEPWDM